jgi:2-amino-4-hydroxy-6-hydroxymethyldihydropteridine diphosphokinase
VSQVTQSLKPSEILPQIRSNALIAVGSNINFREYDVRECILSAVESISQQVGVIRSVSRFYLTPAFPKDSGPDFQNAALVVETSLDPSQLLARLHAIEAAHGRDRSQRWGPRTLDLDLVAMDDKVLPDAETHKSWVDLPLRDQMREVPDQLLLPHPRLAERAFVLVPLAEALSLAGLDWRHPVTGASVTQMLEALPEAEIAEIEAMH